jgi:hypothetical protein
MITLFKIAIEFGLFFLVAFGGIYVGVKLQQKWPSKVADVLAFFGSTESTAS